MGRKSTQQVFIRSCKAVPGPKPQDVMEREAYETFARMLLARDKVLQAKAEEDKQAG